VRKVVLYMQSTINGFAIDDDMEWLTVSDQTWEIVGALQDSCDTVLVGRKSYEEFAGFWPGAVDDESNPPGMLSHARYLSDTEKVVFTKTLKKADWQNTRLVHDDLVEEVGKLKAGTGKDLLLLGGIDLVHSFAQNDLIDEYRILVNPATIVPSTGRMLFTDRLNMRLIEAKPFESGVVAMHYARAK
jgi:dihydrofolate reductase